MDSLLPSFLNNLVRNPFGRPEWGRWPMGIGTQVRKAAEQGVSPARLGDWLDMGRGEQISKYLRTMEARLLTITEGS